LSQLKSAEGLDIVITTRPKDAAGGAGKRRVSHSQFWFLKCSRSFDSFVPSFSSWARDHTIETATTQQFVEQIREGSSQFKLGHFVKDVPKGKTVDDWNAA
jgi:hypothetical protein